MSDLVWGKVRLGSQQYIWWRCPRCDAPLYEMWPGEQTALLLEWLSQGDNAICSWCLNIEFNLSDIIYIKK